MSTPVLFDPLPVGNPPLSAGKIPPALLADLLTDLPTADPRLLVGPSIGEDAAVIDLFAGQPDLLVAKSDPITFATDEIGFYAVNVCANDMAVTGATPLFYLPTVLLPSEDADLAAARRIFEQIGEACRRLNVVVVGGHSEITPTVRRPVVAGTMLGLVPRSRFLHSGGGRPGDILLIAGGAPIEGASIIARERRAELLARGWSASELDEAAGYLYEPGISVVTPAHLAARHGLATAMHDPTEGGVVTGLLEMAAAAGVGMEVDLDAVPTPPLARRLCDAFGLDPLGTIASGALLAAAAPENVDRLLALWAEHGWTGVAIGRVLPASSGVSALRGGVACPFPRFAADEITRLFV